MQHIITILSFDQIIGSKTGNIMLSIEVSLKNILSFEDLNQILEEDAIKTIKKVFPDYFKDVSAHVEHMKEPGKEKDSVIHHIYVCVTENIDGSFQDQIKSQRLRVTPVIYLS